VTRLSGYFLPTEKEAPADAEAISHRLMVRAGLIRQLGAGLWTWLPAGWRVHQRITAIVREELDAIGAQEMLMPVIQPAELWKRSGRYSIEELFKLNDRRGAELVLAMTSEEAVTTHVAPLVRSYRDLPLILYHVQVKGRDEPRPRAGVLRTREFVMKDSYSFDRDPEGLQRAYEAHISAYDRIFDRSGLRWYRVGEYMAPCPAGENDVALAPGYAANVEVASAEPARVELPSPDGPPQAVETPGATTIAELAGQLSVPAGATLKAFPIVVEDRGLLLTMLRGDHRGNALGAPWRPATPAEIRRELGPPGFIGPVGARVPVLLDDGVGEGGAYVVGANRAEFHLAGVVPGRDFVFERADIRAVEPGDLVNGAPITIEPAIEIGNIFQLGTRFSKAFGATYLDEQGVEQLIWMGCYGIGMARVAAAAVEQFADEHGICWPPSIAPFQVHLVALGRAGSAERELAESVYATLREGGVEVVYDDRDGGAGEKFADAELLGVPLRLTVGRRAVESGEIEVVRRRGREQLPGVTPDELLVRVAELCRELG